LKLRTFAPTLIVSPGKEKIVERLQKLAAKADSVYLAPDPDREGEAIAAHLSMQLKPMLKKNATIQRVTFNEITKKAVQEAFLHARDVNENLVNAQQTRRVLDRLVGYQISPLLWDKVRRGLSAGRVQTVALRLIVEREREIAAFQPVEHWTIDAKLKPGAGEEFTAKFVGVDGAVARVANGVDADGKAQFLSGALADEDAAEAVLDQLKKASWSVANVERKQRRRNPTAPYITSKLQQDASNRLGFNVRRTMGVAQRLYEGVEIGSDGIVGLITYMRTDSTRVSDDSVTAARDYAKKVHGVESLSKEPMLYKGKSDAQDAHEAIRPTNVDYTPDAVRSYLSEEQYKLYKLIWQKFVSSQMAAAVSDTTTIEIAAKADRIYDFRISGSILVFPGYLAVWENASEDTILPDVKAGDALASLGVNSEQRFTEPPPRFNEASLVKTLEEKGIGRPSTYASIINTIQDRDYVKKIGAKFVPTEIGMVVTELLVKNFPYIFEAGYTAKLEGELDAVEAGRERWTDLLDGFYNHLEKELAVAGTEMEDIKRREEATDEICDKCGSKLVLKWGKFGSFYSCSNFTKAKAVTIAAGPWKKDSKAVLKKVLGNFHFPMYVKAVTFDETNFQLEVADAKAFAKAVAEAAPKGKRVVAEPVSCDFTKENFAAKPDLSAPGADEAPEEEFCDNCGRQMVLKNGPWGPFMSCPGYSDDPPCKTIRKLTQKVQTKPPVQLDEACPKCGKPLLRRDGSYGEFVACSGYPKCKYVQQELLDVKCPKDNGDLAVRKTKRGDTFYGCVNYPKCDFSSNLKLVNETCPRCDAAYLVEYGNKEGTYMVCPNNREFLPKRRPKKGQPAEIPTTPECTYERLIGPPKQAEVAESEQVGTAA
jgi:DNA topoisomerase-1